MANLVLDVIDRDHDIDRLTEAVLAGFDAVPVPADIPPYEATPFAVALCNLEGGIEGGVIGHSVWDWLYVRFLWVSEAHRGDGYGRQLLNAAESKARDRACHGIWLHTLSFQAPAFYERQGYEMFGELEDMPKGHRRLFYKKALSPR